MHIQLHELCHFCVKMQGESAKYSWLKQKRFILDAVREASFVVRRSRTRRASIDTARPDFAKSTVARQQNEATK